MGDNSTNREEDILKAVNELAGRVAQIDRRSSRPVGGGLVYTVTMLLAIGATFFVTRFGPAPHNAAAPSIVVTVNGQPLSVGVDGKPAQVTADSATRERSQAGVGDAPLTPPRTEVGRLSVPGLQADPRLAETTTTIRPRHRLIESFSTTSPTTRPAAPALLEMFRERDTPAALALAEPVELHFIDVGQGDCILIVHPDGRRVLVDCGTTTEEFDWESVRRYIHSRLPEAEDADNYRYLDVLVVTHPDADHYNLIPKVLGRVIVGQVYTVGDPEEHPSGNMALWLENHADGTTILDQSPATPKKLIDFGPLDFWLLAANVEANTSKKNARSIVLKMTYGEFDAMLTGDATQDTEKDILERYAQDGEFLDVELLKLGHHGSYATNKSAKWSKAVKPEVAVVSCAYDNGYSHPRKESIERLFEYTEDRPAHQFRWWYDDSANRRRVRNFSTREAVYSTAVSGTVVVTSRGQGFDVQFDGN